MKARSLLFSVSWLFIMNYICNRTTEEMWIKIKMQINHFLRD